MPVGDLIPNSFYEGLALSKEQIERAGGKFSTEQPIYESPKQEGAKTESAYVIRSRLMRSQGLCTRCGQPSAPHSLCQKHRDIRHKYRHPSEQEPEPTNITREQMVEWYREQSSALNKRAAFYLQIADCLEKDIAPKEPADIAIDQTD